MKLVTAGVGKSEVVSLLSTIKEPADEVTATSDMDAALKLRTNAVDFYIGTCHTGAGASLGVIPGLVGADKTHTFGRKVPTREEVDKLIADGKVAFGICIDQIDQAVPIVWEAMKGSGK